MTSRPQVPDRPDTPGRPRKTRGSHHHPLLRRMTPSNIPPRSPQTSDARHNEHHGARRTGVDEPRPRDTELVPAPSTAPPPGAAPRRCEHRRTRRTKATPRHTTGSQHEPARRPPTRTAQDDHFPARAPKPERLGRPTAPLGGADVETIRTWRPPDPVPSSRLPKGRPPQADTGAVTARPTWPLSQTPDIRAANPFQQW